MIISDIEKVTLLVFMFFLLPILFTLYKSRNYKIEFVNFVNLCNNSLKFQGLFILVLMPLSWILKKLYFNILLGESIYTFIVVAIFMYLPSLAFLNLIKLILKNKNFK